MRARVVLDVAGRDWKGPVLVPRGSHPLFRSELGEGFDLVCGACKAGVLGENVLKEQFYGIGLQCFSCHAVSKTADLPVGDPLPVDRTTVVSEQVVAVGHPLRVDRFTAYASLEAAEQVARETGIRTPWAIIRSNQIDKEIDPQTSLRAANLPFQYPPNIGTATTLTDGIERAIGELPPSLRAISTTTVAEDVSGSSTMGHPLVLACGRLRGIPRSASELSVELLMDWSLLFHTTCLFYRWRNHPRFGRLTSNLVSPNDYLHDMAVLAVASYLADLGNGVSLVKEGKTGRVSDIEISGGALDRMAVEVKARQELRPGRSLLTPELATRAVRGAVDSAGINSGGQLDPAKPGVLAMGGYTLTRDEFGVCLESAHRVIKDWPDTVRHVAAILVCSVGFLRPDLETGKPRVDVPEFVAGFAPNPNYNADMMLRPYSLTPVLVLPSKVLPLIK
jgi:hypothetical protein